MAGKICKFRGRVELIFFTVLLCYVGASLAQDASRYQDKASAPVLTQVVKEISEAKQMMQSTKEKLNLAENTISKLNHDGQANQGFKGQKLVHLDLSGAPPKMSYLLQLVPFVKQWGATGFLVEYVDTFPFKDDLNIIRGKDVYSEEEIKQFLQECTKHQMLVIPLVQTFGHLEYVLKHPVFADLRETKRYTNSICPKNPKSLVLIKKMIDQILQLHPGSSWLHVGGDEVWNLKTCSKCKNQNESNSDIFLGHMIPVLEYVKQHSKTPIMWDDMMRDWDLNKLIRMGQLVEPMLWGYRTPLSQHFPKDTWSRYNAAFKRVWMASAFKGAFKSNADYVKISVRVQNNLDWVHAVANLPNVTVAGLALTGWSRYDYFGSLCELLPAAIPSLAVCLTAIRKGYIDDNVVAEVSNVLGLKKPININDDYPLRPSECQANFPGHDVFKVVCDLSTALHKLDLAIDTKNTWTLPRQMKANELSYFRLMFGKSISQGAIKLLVKLKKEAKEPLAMLYSNNTINEWFADKIDENLAASNRVKTSFLDALKHYEEVFKQSMQTAVKDKEQENIETVGSGDDKEHLKQQQEMFLEELVQQNQPEQDRNEQDKKTQQPQQQQAQQTHQQHQQQQHQQVVQQPQQQQQTEDQQQQQQQTQLQQETQDQQQQQQQQQQTQIQQQTQDQQQQQQQLQQQQTQDQQQQQQQQEVVQQQQQALNDIKEVFEQVGDQNGQEKTLPKQEDKLHHEQQQREQQQHEQHHQQHEDEANAKETAQDEHQLELQKQYSRKQSFEESHARPQVALDHLKEAKIQEQKRLDLIRQYYIRRPQLNHRPKDAEQEKKLRQLQFAVEHRLKDLNGDAKSRQGIVNGLAQRERLQNIGYPESFRQQQEILKEVGTELRDSHTSNSRKSIDDFSGRVVNLPRDYFEYAYGQVKPLAMNKINQVKPKARLGTFQLKTSSYSL